MYLLIDFMTKKRANHCVQAIQSISFSFLDTSNKILDLSFEKYLPFCIGNHDYPFRDQIQEICHTLLKFGTNDQISSLCQHFQ